MGGGVEAEEGERVVQEVAGPNGDGEEDEERHVAYVLHRDDARPQADECLFHLIIYTQAAQENDDERECGKGANDGHPPADGGEMREDLVDASAWQASL